MQNLATTSWVTKMTETTTKTAAKNRTRPSPSKRFRTETRGMTKYTQPTARDGYHILGRRNAKTPSTKQGPPESAYEKQMILPAHNNREARDLVWADARFAVDIMSEHAMFFSLLMPEELAPDEKAMAKDFQQTYAKLFARIDQKGPPSAGEVKGFVRGIAQDIQPLVDFKEDSHRRQVDGSLQSLVWPLFFDHTRREAVRWVARMQDIADGHVELDRKEVVTFWGGIMDEHARFVAHLLDPEEYDLIEQAFAASGVFQELVKPGGTVRALAREPGMVMNSLAHNPELDAVESAAQTILDFKTDAVRKLETAQIKSIIHPTLADHVRREAVKFLDELRRTKEE